MKVAKKDLRFRVSLALGALALASGMVVACGPESNSAPPSQVTPGATGCIEDKDNDGYGPGCALGADCDDNDPKNTTQCRACLNNESGCPCAAEGKRIKCGKVSSRQGDTVTCSMGARLCTGGKWSACEPGAWGPGHDGFITTKTKTQTVGGAAGSCLDCDPNCHLVQDTPDNLPDAGPDAAFIGEGGTIVYPNNNSTTPTPAEINALSNVDGGFDGGIIKVLVTGQTSATPDPVNVIDPRPAGGDIYFMIDDTSSMGPVAAALRDSIALEVASPPCIPDPTGGLMAPPGGGIVQNLKCKFGNDVFIGMGRYEDYGEYKGFPGTATAFPNILPTPGGAPWESVPFEHILSVQAAALPAQQAATFLGNTAFNGGASLTVANAGMRAGGDIPESLIPALYAAGVGDGFLKSGTTVFWTKPRSTWSTPWSGSPLASDVTGGNCTNGGTGYPCWRPQTTPIFVIMTDAPSHNGPGGQYAYPQYNPTWVNGAAFGPKTNQTPNNDPGANPPVAKTFATANELQYETDATGNVGLKPRLYYGTVTPNFPVQGGNGTQCTSPNVCGWPSNSSVFGGLNNIVAGSGRRSLRDCGGTNATNVSYSNTTTSNNGTATAFGNYDIPWPAANEERVAPPNCGAVGGGVFYTNNCGTSTSRYTDGGGIASYSGGGASTPFNNIRITTGGGTQVRMNGSTAGFDTFVVPAIGSRVEFRITMLDDAQAGAPNARLYAGNSNLTDINGLGVFAKSGGSSQASSVFYTTSANSTVRFAVNTTTPNVIVNVEYWVRPPSLPACTGFILYPANNIPQCFTCKNGYTQSGNQCCGNDQANCPGGTTWAPAPACAQAASGPQAALPRGGQVGNCFTCGAGQFSAETGAPKYARAISNGGASGCYRPTCQVPYIWKGSTVGGPGWSFDSGGPVAANGSSRCVRAASELQCSGGVSPICTTLKGLCNGYQGTGASSWAKLPNPPGGTINSLCGCSGIDGLPLKADHPVIPGGAPATGVLSTYFVGGSTIYSSTSPQGAANGWAMSTVPGQGAPTTRFESGGGWLTGGGNPGLPAIFAAQPAGVGISDFQSRTTAQISVPCTGIYEFGTNNDDTARLWIADRMAVETFAAGSNSYSGNQQYNFVGSPFNPLVGSPNWQYAVPVRFALTAGVPYNVKYEVAQKNDGSYYGQLIWRNVSAGCTAGGVTVTTGFTQVPALALKPTYVAPNAPGDVAQCITEATYTATTTNTVSANQNLGDGAWQPESIYKFTVPAGKRFYYHFGLLRSDQTSTAAVVTTSPGTFLYLKQKGTADAAVGSPTVAPGNSQVVDCNRSTVNWSGGSTNLLAEINGNVGPGDYYLVVDNANGPAPASYNYVLQVNQFEESTTIVGKAPTAPTYKETIAKLQSMGAKVIGLENSGVSCGQAADPTTSFAQYETLDHLKKLAIDTGSVDATNQPIVVSLRKNAASCDGLTAAPASLTTQMNSAVNTLANTLRQDLVLRATKSGAAPSPDIDPLNAAFVAENFVADVTADSSTTLGRCGNPPTNPGQPQTGPDFDPSFTAPNTREMFNSCLPGAPVRFNVRFKVPNTVQRTAVDQFFRFDLAVSSVARDAFGNKTVGTILARIPVVIKVPSANAGTADAPTNVYDSQPTCTPGTRALWSGFGYNTQAPEGIVGKDSKIEIYFSTTDTFDPNVPWSAPEYQLATSTRLPPITANCATGLNPRTEVCDRVDLKGAIIAAGQLPNKRYIRFRFKAFPSPDATNRPTILDWKVHLSCVPSE